MTDEKFKQIELVKCKIEEHKRKITTIDVLFRSCGISCVITGTPRTQFGNPIEYYFSGKDEIIKILHLEKEKLSNELSDLEKLFSEY